MKKMKLTSKKVLSVFLAVLMVMTAWVFVAPEKAEAYSEISSILTAEELSAFKTFIGVANTDTHVVETTYGTFSDDGTNQDTSKTYHKNVFLSGTAKKQVGISSYTLSDNAIQSANIYYPDTVLIYDGTTTPQFGLTLVFDSHNGCQLFHWGTSISGTNLSFVNSNWYGGVDGTTNGSFMSVITSSNKQCGKTSSSAAVDTGSYYAPSKDGWASVSNVVKYTGNLGSDRNSATYYTTISPTFKSHFSQAENSGCNATGYKGDKTDINLGTATNSVAVINIVPWKTALEHAANQYKQILTNGEQNYTLASVTAFKKYAKALFDAHPSKLVTGVGDVSEFSKNKTAVNDYYNNGQLVEARFKVTYKNGSTTVKEYTDLKYNADVPVYSETNFTKAPDATYHYEFNGWNPTPGGKVTSDITYDAVFEPIEHTIATKKENIKDATCTVAGSYTLVTYCSVCDHEIKREDLTQTPIPHVYDREVANAAHLASEATCIAPAKYYKSCYCGANDTMNTFEYGNPDYSKHQLVPVAGSESSCTTEGMKSYYTCSVCGKNFLDEKDAPSDKYIEDESVLLLPIKPHKLVEKSEVAPTCDEEGKKAHWECSVCYTTFKDDAGAEVVDEDYLKIPALGHIDKDRNHICDNGCNNEGCYEDFVYNHEDFDPFDHKCDYCGKEDPENFEPHIDTDKDHFCDSLCDEPIGAHEDKNKDHACDYGCSEAIGACEDVNPVDHKCDWGCSKYYGTHADADKDHNCDYGCAEKIGTCEDADKDHDCDYGCDKVYGDHVDANTDHACDYGCKETIGTCEDADFDHDCDYGCDKFYGTHADAENDGNHDCEYCGKKASECTKGEEVKENFVDSTCETEGSYNSVFYCTECGEVVERTDNIKIEKKPHVWSVSYEWAEDGSTCTAIHSCSSETPHQETAEATVKYAVTKNPECGIRGETKYTATFNVDWATEQVITLADIDPKCPDANLDHRCDTYPEDDAHYVGAHEDKNKDHACDYGCLEAIGACEDVNPVDHKCDWGCGKTFGVCEDKDLDHKCDYGCDKFYGTHADAENDGNHDCEYCGEKIGECTPGEEKIENKTDSTCDAEGKYDSVYYCTECGKEISRTTVVIEKKDHDWGATVYSWDKDAKTFTATRTCQNFASHVETETVAAIEEILVAPKCETLESPRGLAKYTSAFTVDWATEQTEEVVLEALPHKDDNKDHKCDSGCNEIFGTCVDADKDHYCDYGCGTYYGVHEDLTGENNRPDHFCDYCKDKISDCVDENKDHNCDYGCGARYGECEDRNEDHYCDYGVECEFNNTEKFGICVDNDKDHHCDNAEGCKKVFASHEWTTHNEDTDTLKSAATCKSPAIYNNICVYCGEVVDGGTHEYGEVDAENGHNFNGNVVSAGGGKHSVKCTVEGCSERKLVDCNYQTTKEVAATCRKQGAKTEKCLVCKSTKKTTTEKDPTNHEGGTRVKDTVTATCNTNGYTGNTYCIGCDTVLEEGSVVTANPVIHAHENMKDYAKLDSTCSAEGYEAYRYCDKCKTYAIEKVVIAKKAHKYSEYISNNDGTHSAECETCGTAQNNIACTGGTANCVDKKVCEFCNVAYGEIDSTKHKKTYKVAKKEATCQVEGYAPYLKCEACDTALEEIKPIEKKEHTYGEWTKVSGENKHQQICLTCDEKVDTVASIKEDCSGGKAYCNKLAVCKVCRAEYGSYDGREHRSTVTTLVGKKEATCYEEGYTGDAYYICCYDADKSADENASALKEKGTKIDTIAHTYSIEIISARVPATCKNKGETVYKCATCPENNEATEKVILDVDPTNHSGGTITIGAKAATCTEDGFSGNVYYNCCYNADKSEADNIGALKSKGSVIKANGEHTYSDVYPEYMIDEIIINEDEDGNIISRKVVIKTETPTYDEMVAARRADGFWYHGKMCTRCYEIVEERCYSYTSDNASCTAAEVCEICEGLCSLKNEKNHAEMELIEGYEATCTDDGRKDSYKCTACGKTFLDAAGKNEITAENEYKLVIEANGAHTIDRASKPEAKNNGTHVYKCSICGEAEISENCSGGTATCKTLKKCEYCDASYGELNARNHEEGTIEIGRVDPVKCKPGVKGQVKYTCCDKVVSGGEEIPALEAHSWVEETSKTDNCAQGYTITRTCTVCDTVETEDVAAGSHNLSVVVYETEKSCTTDRSVYYACSICSHTENEVVINGVTYKYIALEQIPAKGECTWTGWTTVKATCVAEGSKSRSCIICGKTENVVLPKVAHTIFVENGYAATCENAGKQDLAFCVVPDCPYAKGGQPIGTVPGYEKYADSKGRVINALGHGDKNGDDYCDNCGRYEGVNSDGTNCNCVCHKQNGFMKLWYKFLQFFWKLFKINKSCCSVGVHY